MRTPYRVRTVYLVAKDEGPEFEGPGGDGPDAVPEEAGPGPEDDAGGRRREHEGGGLRAEDVPAGAWAGREGRGPRREDGRDGGQLAEHGRQRALEPVLRRAGEAVPLRREQGLRGDGVHALGPAVAEGARAHGAGRRGASGFSAGGRCGAGRRRWPRCRRSSPTARVLDPQVEMDDSGLRGTVWASAATGVGAMLHEMGHTFGLPHSTDGRSAMSRGFDLFNRRFVAYEPPRKGARPRGGRSATRTRRTRILSRRRG